MKCKLLCLFSLISLSLSAQEFPHAGGWGLSAGWTQSFIYDEHASPLMYKSDLLNLSGLYQKRGVTRFEVALSISIGNNQPRQLGQRTATIEYLPDIYGHVDSDEIKANPFLSMLNGNLRVKMLWPVGNHHHLGASLNTRYTYTAIGIDTWQYGQVDLSPEYLFSYPFLDGEVECSASLPLFAGVMRMNYAFDPSLPDETNYFKGYLRTGTRITSINELINPKIRAGYLWHFPNGRDLGAYYSASWLSYTDPRPMKMFENGIDVVYFF